jgi:multisubunit Na+/H+ antiporter MnhC subunit
VLWLLILLAATAVSSVRTLCLMSIAWVTLNIALPVNSADPRIIAGMALVSQAIIVVLLALALRQRQELPVVTQ